MKKKDQGLPMSFKIISFEGLNIEVTKFKHITDQEFDNSKISVSIDLDIENDSIDIELIEVFCHVRYVYDLIGNDGKPLEEDDSEENRYASLLHIDTLTTFSIAEFEKHIQKNKRGRFLRTEFVTLFFGIAFASSRGYIAAKSEGTLYNEVPLPSLNPTEFVKENKKDHLAKGLYFI